MDETTAELFALLSYLLLELGIARKTQKTLDDKASKTLACVRRYEDDKNTYDKNKVEDERVIALKPWQRWLRLLFATTKNRNNKKLTVNPGSLDCDLLFARIDNQNATDYADEGAGICTQLMRTITNMCGCDAGTINLAANTAYVADQYKIKAAAAYRLAEHSWDSIHNDVFYCEMISFASATRIADSYYRDALNARINANTACASAEQAILLVIDGAVAKVARDVAEQSRLLAIASQETSAEHANTTANTKLDDSTPPPYEAPPEYSGALIAVSDDSGLPPQYNTLTRQKVHVSVV